MKRFFDLFCAAIGLLLLSPIFAAIALLILTMDGSPVIYRRRVVGQRQDFDAFKFRTMRRDADAWLESQPELKAEYQRNFKLQADPRVTQIGRWLRKTSLDELPQLVNVLRGEMSIVGPRMITREELVKYRGFEDRLKSVKPGITGLWQVSGRQTVEYETRVKIDMDYIERQNFWLDFKIILLTPLKVLKKEGAF